MQEEFFMKLELDIMKTIKILKAAVIIIIITLACFASYNAGKSSVYKAENNYYNKVEELLDSINNWDESFMDTVMETDTYYEYEIAREGL